MTRSRRPLFLLFFLIVVLAAVLFVVFGTDLLDAEETPSPSAGPVETESPSPRGRRVRTGTPLPTLKGFLPGTKVPVPPEELGFELEDDGSEDGIYTFLGEGVSTVDADNLHSFMQVELVGNGWAVTGSTDNLSDSSIEATRRRVSVRIEIEEVVAAWEATITVCPPAEDSLCQGE